MIGLAACGGGDDDDASDSTADGAVVTSEPSENDDASENDDSASAVEQSPDDASSTDTTQPTEPSTDSDVDLDVPPEPDPNATDADHPDFEWAFEEGYLTASGYGRVDFYDPSTVSEPGSAVGLAAAEAYRDGFALGLAEYEAAVAAEEELTATVLDASIVGKVIRQGVGEDWVAETAGVTEECGAIVEATNPGVPCITRWINAEDGDVIALRLGNSGKEIDIAMLVQSGQGGREVLAWWARADGDPMPEWVTPWNGMPDYLQGQ